MKSRRRFLAVLLAAGGLPLTLAGRVTETRNDPLRAVELAHATQSNNQSPPEIRMNPKNCRSPLTSLAVALAVGIALGIAIERTPTPGDDPLLVYAMELMKRGAAQGSSPEQLARFLTTNPVSVFSTAKAKEIQK